MKALLSKVYLGVAILLMSIENSPADCFQRLLKRKLTSNEIDSKNFDDIRNIVSASLTEDEPRDTVEDKKREVSNAQSDDKSSLEIASEDNNNVASESKDTLVYDDEVGEDDGNQQHVRQLDDADSKESPAVIGERVAKSVVDRSEPANEEEPDLNIVKEVTKREVRNEDEYDEDDSETNPESPDSPVASDGKNEIARSTLDNKNSDSDPKKIDSTRDTSALAEDSDLDYEKQIEAQIQQRIDAIKEDIKREIERKQQIREIEINNAKFDELEFPSEDDEVAADVPSDSSKRSLFDDPEVNSESQKAISNVRSKRRSDNEVVKNEDTVNSALPVKKRRYARRMTLVTKRNTPKRKERSSILIPEQGHAEVKDDLPADLTLDPNLRIARSYERDRDSENLRSARSAPIEDDEYAAGRYRRDEFADKVEVNEVPEEASNFLFPSREKSDPRSRRRRSRSRNRARSINRRKSRKSPRHLRRHRAIRESSMEDANRPEERDKRAMSLDEDAALEYKESFGGFQSDSGGVLGRFKRIKRSSAAEIS